ncbi:hypothetical protein GJV26_18960 [Massilia dura]|uniref:DUF1007 family protein n=1 Tax=Pseudoduganella dura TaxID=321982 RepID=A0A6I3XMT2_9BURK|nr:DUF6702 family protein [Pseudoduganella dura]MUI14522.1 hypothetical protein [Pseudoduganella dura]GGY18619.1 hypothetical protein GCM10007386_55100 [Pseudoduganella dura]
MLRRFRKAALVAALFPVAAAAHNYHMGLADIGYNAATGNTEIVHTYTAHDVEALLTNLYGRQFDLGMEEDQEALRRYLDKRFVLTVDGRHLPLQWVGMKASADTITVFQQIDRTALPAGAVLKNGVLTDFLPAQINTVNVGGSAGRATVTLTFTAAQGEQRLP